MEKKDIEKSILDLDKEIKKIDAKKSKFMFYVIDTKGTPSGSLWYIYSIAHKISRMGYIVEMLHNENDFVGVKDWMGEEYANLPHFNIEKNNIDVSPSDILFIPELYSQVMFKTKGLPCKRVVILQNFNFLTEIIPYGTTWEDYGIRECIANTEFLSNRIKEVFPNTITHIVRPAIRNCFKETEEPKKLIINYVSRTKTADSIIKPFMWKYPMLKWISFRNLGNLTQEEMAKHLQESVATIWVDDNTNFGYSALESLATGNIVIGKVPQDTPEWSVKEGELKDNALWFYNDYDAAKVIAGFAEAYLNNGIPVSVYDDMKQTIEPYTEQKQEEDIRIQIIEGILAQRKKELEIAKVALENHKNSKKKLDR